MLSSIWLLIPCWTAGLMDICHHPSVVAAAQQRCVHSLGTPWNSTLACKLRGQSARRLLAIVHLRFHCFTMNCLTRLRIHLSIFWNRIQLVDSLK